MAEKNGNGQQGVDLFVMLHGEVKGVLGALDQLERRADRFDAELNRFREEMQSYFADQKQVYGEMKSHFLRIAEMLVTVGDRLNDHDRRLAALESRFR